MALDNGSPISSPSGNNILQSFSDATAGRSIQLFYGVCTTNSTGTDQILVKDIEDKMK
jgi:hypothetical protein